MPRYKDNKDNRENQQIAYNYFLQKGLSPQASAGIVGNLMQESMLNPNAVGDKGQSIGIGQWYKDRNTALKKAYPDSYQTLDSQLNFIWDELNTTHTKALTKLREAPDAESATIAFQDEFERPNKKYARTENRVRFAQGVLNQSTVPKETISIPEREVSYTPPPPPKTEQTSGDVMQSSLQNKIAKYNLVQDIFSQPLPTVTPVAVNSPQQRAQFIDPYEELLGGRTIFQDGGTYDQDKQWLQNWYENREIPNQAIQNLYLEDKPSFVTQSQFIPDPQIVDSIDDDPTIRGQYDPETGSIKMTPSANTSTYLHEATHKTQDFSSYMRPVHEALVNKNLRPQESLPAQYRNDYDYYSDPDEVHARIQVLRRDAGIQPNETVTPEFIQNYFKNYQGNDQNINDLRQLTDEEGLLQLLNYMAANQPMQNTNLQYGQQGGVIEDDMGQWRHPGKVTRINSSNITMKNVPYKVLGVDNLGNAQMMYPEQDYIFKGSSVTEYPMINNSQTLAGLLNNKR